MKKRINRILENTLICVLIILVVIKLINDGITKKQISKKSGITVCTIVNYYEIYGSEYAEYQYRVGLNTCVKKSGVDPYSGKFDRNNLKSNIGILRYVKYSIKDPERSILLYDSIPQ